jgi:transposase
MQSKRRWLPRWQRIELAELCLVHGMSRRQAAEWRRVSVATVQFWVDRRRAATPEQIASGAWADSRSSTPKHQPALSSSAVHDRVCEARERTGWGPRPIASQLGMESRARPGNSHRRPLPRRGRRLATAKTVSPHLISSVIRRASGSRDVAAPSIMGALSAGRHPVCQRITLRSKGALRGLAGSRP